MEVSVRNMSAEDRERTRAAQQVEVGEWIKENVVEALDPQLHYRSEDVMRMRWVLTWKPTEDHPSGRKAKARLVLLGSEDPRFGQEEYAAPTMTLRSRMLQYQSAVNRGWTVWKADVKAACLQGHELAWGVPELCESLGIEPGSALRIHKAAYGFATEPR